MDYLGQHIELIEEGSGWVAIWWHSVGLIEIGFFPTAHSAWEAAVELIQREFAVRSLLDVLEDWTSTEQISEWEYAASVDSLVQFVLAA